MIADKHCSEAQLVNAIRNLGSVNESPKFWTDIAEDDSYSRLHRRHSIFQLFYRHVVPGMSLSQLAFILQRPSWLTEKEITIVEDLGGHIPVSLSLGNTVLVFNVIPDSNPNSDRWHPDRWQIYMSVTGQIHPNGFYRLLGGGAVNQATSEATILEVGFSPPALDSLHRAPLLKFGWVQSSYQGRTFPRSERLIRGLKATTCNPERWNEESYRLKHQRAAGIGKSKREIDSKA